MCSGILSGIKKDKNDSGAIRSLEDFSKLSRRRKGPCPENANALIRE